MNLMGMNGHLFPDLSIRELPVTTRPVVGTRRAHVAYPLDAPATIVGQYGRAWKCDLDTARLKIGVAAGQDATVAHWMVEAPWSHEVLHSYSLVLIHLRFALGRPIVQFLPGATHELALCPIHPAAPRIEMLAGPINPTMWVPPLAFASQIAELTDAAAEERIRRAMELVCAGRLSPHPDHLRSWVELFGDCMMKHAKVVHAEETEA